MLGLDQKLIPGPMILSLAAGLAVLRCDPAAAIPSYAVLFDDPGGAHSAYYPAITTNLTAAGTDWADVFGNQGDARITLQVAFTPAIPTMDTTSMGAHLVDYDPVSGIAVYEQGAAAKLKGNVPDTMGIDGRIRIGETYLGADLWFDPDPADTTVDVPGLKVDAYSMFRHELGHVFAFNGWRDDSTGALDTPYRSTFDRWVVSQNGALFFTGPHAEAAYGGPVPLTHGNARHVGNGPGGPGQDLIPDLMNGVTWLRGTRYEISPLDRAIAADAGLPVAGLVVSVPEPPSLLALASGSAVLLFLLGFTRRPGQGIRGIQEPQGLRVRRR